MDLLEIENTREIVCETLDRLSLDLLEGKCDFGASFDENEKHLDAADLLEDIWMLNQDQLDEFMESFNCQFGYFYVATLQSLKLAIDLLNWPVKFAE